MEKLPLLAEMFVTLFVIGSLTHLPPDDVMRHAKTCPMTCKNPAD
jgi:hypothetical protein